MRHIPPHPRAASRTAPLHEPAPSLVQLQSLSTGKANKTRMFVHGAKDEAATFRGNSFARLSHAPACPPRQMGFIRPARPEVDVRWVGVSSEGCPA